MQYIVLTVHARFENLTKQVEEKLKQGWKLQGGVAVVSRLGEIHLYQAMVKE